MLAGALYLYGWCSKLIGILALLTQSAHGVSFKLLSFVETPMFTDKQIFFRVLVLFAMFALFPVAGEAQDLPMAEDLSAQRAALEEAGEQIAEASEEKLIELREMIRAVRLDAEASVAALDARKSELEEDLNRITSLEGDPPPGIRELQPVLQKEFEEVDAAVRQTELNVIEANRLLVDIAERRREAFYRRVLERHNLPFTAPVLNAAIGSLKTNVETFKTRYDTWAASFETPEDRSWAWMSILLSAAAAFVLLWPIPRLIERTLLANYKNYEPTRQRRTVLAGLRFIARILPTLLAGTIVYQVLVANGVVTDETSKLVGSILLALGTIVVVEDIASVVFDPKEPDWRLIPLASKRAVAVRLSLVLTVIVFSANAVLIRLSEWLGSSRELVELGNALLSIAGAGLFIALSRKRLWQLIEKRKFKTNSESQRFWSFVRIVTAGLAISSVIAILVGYISLGRFVLTRMYFLAFLFVAAWFARALMSDIANWVGGWVHRPSDEAEPSSSGDMPEDQRLLIFWLQLLVDLALLAAVVPSILLILGTKWTDIRNWVIDAISGVEIGGFTFSLGAVFTAIIALVVILFLTRLVQRASDARIFAPAGMDSGLRNTFRTLIGYAGLVVGVVVAIATLGFSFANFALVAGALSLGIGFGLQSIVNNFVSGLILLFERPIKVGDWIVTAAGEGIVKRISVRSTEIETFDWASVIIPNSELITAPVTNWTHKNRYTRMIVPVGVSYDADPEQVTEILTKEAKANKRALTFPKPVIYFAGFGDSSLDFEVRVFINNVDDRIPVQNELRIAIFKAFKEAGIEIPFPQRDVHMRVPKGAPDRTTESEKDAEAGEPEVS